MQALFYQIGILEEDEEAEKASLKTEQQQQHLDEKTIFGGDKRKMLILIDIVLFQAALLVPGEIGLLQLFLYSF